MVWWHIVVWVLSTWVRNLWYWELYTGFLFYVETLQFFTEVLILNTNQTTLVEKMEIFHVASMRAGEIFDKTWKGQRACIENFWQNIHAKCKNLWQNILATCKIFQNFKDFYETL